MGGLLSGNDLAGPSPGRKEYTFDGNGNVSEVLDAAGFPVAHYEYDPFGSVVSANGMLANYNSVRFNTKYFDEEIDCVYYGYRYYNPAIGRWINRDPIEEKGGIGLYLTTGNDLQNRLEILGLVELNAKLTRKTRGYFGIYGTLTLAVSNRGIQNCCGLPITVKTLERPPGTGPKYAPFTSTGPFSGRLRPGDTGQHDDLDTSPQHLAGLFGVSLPAKPRDINEHDWEVAKTHEWNTGNGGINVHAGTTSRDSFGCVLVGSSYEPVSRVFRGYPGVDPEMNYVVPGYSAQDSLLMQLKLNAAIACVERTTGESVSIRFTASSTPSLSHDALPPTPEAELGSVTIGSWRNPQKVRRASIINDPQALH